MAATTTRLMPHWPVLWQGKGVAYRPIVISPGGTGHGDNDVRLHGHSIFAFSLRGARYGYVDCSVMSESAEQVERKWAPLADKAERVVNSFVLDPP
ncbi:hypothetical protein C1D09_018575 [Mesorhizobium intechi]|uniref:Uncharacterized protein n=1 Tax=Mesorhizobium intechi TaxID=537601 RepID=A0A8T9ANV5_9HYPH|nr:hypothetical protein [Mesorhizobium intechi]TSE07539.1 hypothetical protein C1D09_018575 [Mesorhizobium intechi]